MLLLLLLLLLHAAHPVGQRGLVEWRAGRVHGCPEAVGGHGDVVGIEGAAAALEADEEGCAAGLVIALGVGCGRRAAGYPASWFPAGPEHAAGGGAGRETRSNLKP